MVHPGKKKDENNLVFWIEIGKVFSVNSHYFGQKTENVQIGLYNQELKIKLRQKLLRQIVYNCSNT